MLSVEIEWGKYLLVVDRLRLIRRLQRKPVSCMIICVILAFIGFFCYFASAFRSASAFLSFRVKELIIATATVILIIKFILNISEFLPSKVRFRNIFVKLYLVHFFFQERCRSLCDLPLRNRMIDNCFPLRNWRLRLHCRIFRRVHDWKRLRPSIRCQWGRINYFGVIYWWVIANLFDRSDWLVFCRMDIKDSVLSNRCSFTILLMIWG